MAYENLTRTSISLSDGNLTLRDNPVEGRYLLIVGTAAMGPSYTPIEVANINEAVNVFGDPSVGNLIKSIAEAISAESTSTYRLFAMRIGNGSIANATLGSGSNVDFEIRSYNEGYIYNEAFFNEEISDNGEHVIKFYDPVTDEYYYFPFGYGNVYDYETFANAINTHAVLGRYYTASVNSKQTEIFQVSVSDIANMSGVTENNDTYVLKLEDFFFDNYNSDVTGEYIDDDDVVLPGTTTRYNIYRSFFYKILGLDVFRTIDSNREVVELSGKNKGILEHVVKIDDSTGYPTPLLNLNGSSPSVRFVANNVFVGTGDGSVTEFTIDTKEPADNSSVKVYLKHTDNSIEDVTSFVTITVNSSPATLKVSFPTAPAVGEIITADFNTEYFNVTQLFSLSDIYAANDYTKYFITGNEIYFGEVLPYDVELSYDYEESINTNKINFYKVNNEAYVEIDKDVFATDPTIILMQWRYLPGWQTLNTAVSLTGGSAGIYLDPSELLSILPKIFKAIENNRFDIISLPNYTIGTSYTTYSKITGKAYTKFADYIGTIDSLVNERLDYAGPSLCVLPIVGPNTFEPDVVKDYIDGIIGDSLVQSELRAYLQGNRSKYVAIPFGSVTLSNPITGEVYETSPVNIFAAQLAGLPYNEVLTGKKIYGILSENLSLNLNQANQLAGLGLNPIGIYDNAVAWLNADTFADRDSDYVRLSTYFIVNDLLETLTAKLKIYYRRLSNNNKTDELMKVDISSVLNKFAKDLQLIDSNYDFRLYATLAEIERGIRNLDIVIKPAFELKNIRINVRLKLA